MQSLRDMSNMPVEGFKPGTMDAGALTSMVQKFDSSDYVMTAGCHNPINGLVPGHAYTLVGMGDSAGTFKMRNPWGSEQYKGPTSDQKNDGFFDLSIEEFQTAFTTLSVAYFNDYNIAKVHSTKAGADVNFSI